MKKILIAIFSVISSLSFAQDKMNIKGQFIDNSNDGKTIYLKDFNLETGFESIDSCIVKNKAFSFNTVAGVNVPRPGLVAFGSSQENMVPVSTVIIENGKITVSTEGQGKATGSPTNDSFHRFIEQQQQIIDQMKQLSANNGTEAEHKRMEKELNTNNFNYIDQNIGNRLGELLFAETWNTFEPMQALQLLEKTRPQFKDSQIGKSFAQQLRGNPPFIGDNYLDIKLRNELGKEVSLSDYIGKHKVVLLDFWASWCGPCIKEMPSIAKTYAQYKDKGFEIIGISLDEAQGSWQQAIKRLEITWPQMSDLRGWKSQAAILYSVGSIPSTFLIDENGKIIAKNIRANSLGDKLDELLK